MDSCQGIKREIPIVSVIITVYNVQDYLCQCVDSILAQTFDDYELILVDDGSTDQSGTICDEYDKNHSCVRVVHQRNAGLPAARKVGVEQANGNYVLFIDADDWVDPEHLQSLVTVAERENADVTICGFVFEYPRKQVKCTNKPVSSDGRGIILECLNNTHHAGVVFKLIRRSLFVDSDIKFPKYNFFEDMYLSTEILLLTNHICSTGLTTYHYRYNYSSETHSKSTEFRVNKFNEFILNMKELFDNNSLWDDKEMRSALLRRINKEKLELLILPFSAGREIRKAYECYADSWKEYQVGFNLFRLPNYFALRYQFLLMAQLYKHFRVMVRNILKGI